MSTKIKWFKGPPPSIGWWPASRRQSIDSFRWWNGEFWSLSCEEDTSGVIVANRAAQRSPYSDRVEWAHRPDSWPERSRT